MSDYGLPFAVLIAWLICAFVAARLGPESFRVRLFWTTFVVLGPLGVAVALLAKALEEFAPRQ